MTAANVDRHKKVDEKNRFGEVSTEEMQETMEKAVPETTKGATKFWIPFRLD